MLYENISLIMPDEPRYELNKKSDDLIYVKYRISSSRVNGKLKHKRLLIGKLSSEQEGDLKISTCTDDEFTFQAVINKKSVFCQAIVDIA